MTWENRFYKSKVGKKMMSLIDKDYNSNWGFLLEEMDSIIKKTKVGLPA